MLSLDLAACDAYAAGLEHAAQVRCPTLVAIGGQDRMTPPKAGLALAAAIPGAATTTIPGAGHMLMVETPDAVREALAGWMPAAAD